MKKIIELKPTLGDLTITLSPYLDVDHNTGVTIWVARGIDTHNNTYEIIWANLAAGHVIGDDGDCVYEVTNCWCRDEREHLDWENPLSIALIDY